MGACNNIGDVKRRHKGEEKPDKTEIPGKGQACQLCSKTMPVERLKQHMDIKHLALIRESMRQSGIQVFCLVCKFQTISLEGHRRHIETKHKYLENYLKNRGEKEEAHETIRKRITKVKKDYFQWHHLNKGKGVASLQGIKYDVFCYSKDYSSMEYQEYRAEGDLVWKHIFIDHPQARYYYTQSRPTDNSIKATSYIFVQTSF